MTDQYADDHVFSLADMIKGRISKDETSGRSSVKISRSSPRSRKSLGSDSSGCTDVSEEREDGRKVYIRTKRTKAVFNGDNEGHEFNNWKKRHRGQGSRRRSMTSFGSSLMTDMTLPDFGSASHTRGSFTSKKSKNISLAGDITTPKAKSRSSEYYEKIKQQSVHHNLKKDGSRIDKVFQNDSDYSEIVHNYTPKLTKRTVEHASDMRSGSQTKFKNHKGDECLDLSELIKLKSRMRTDTRSSDNVASTEPSKMEENQNVNELIEPPHTISKDFINEHPHAGKSLHTNDHGIYLDKANNVSTDHDSKMQTKEGMAHVSISTQGNENEVEEKHTSEASPSATSPNKNANITGVAQPKATPLNKNRKHNGESPSATSLNTNEKHTKEAPSSTSLKRNRKRTRVDSSSVTPLNKNEKPTAVASSSSTSLYKNEKHIGVDSSSSTPLNKNNKHTGVASSATPVNKNEKHTIEAPLYRTEKQTRVDSSSVTPPNRSVKHAEVASSATPVNNKEKHIQATSSTTPLKKNVKVTVGASSSTRFDKNENQTKLASSSATSPNRNKKHTLKAPSSTPLNNKDNHTVLASSAKPVNNKEKHTQITSSTSPLNTNGKLTVGASSSTPPPNKKEQHTGVHSSSATPLKKNDKQTGFESSKASPLNKNEKHNGVASRATSPNKNQEHAEITTSCEKSCNRNEKFTGAPSSSPTLDKNEELTGVASSSATQLNDNDKQTGFASSAKPLIKNRKLTEIASSNATPLNNNEELTKETSTNATPLNNKENEEATSESIRSEKILNKKIGNRITVGERSSQLHGQNGVQNTSMGNGHDFVVNHKKATGKVKSERNKQQNRSVISAERSSRQLTIGDEQVGKSAKRNCVEIEVKPKGEPYIPEPRIYTENKELNDEHTKINIDASKDPEENPAYRRQQEKTTIKPGLKEIKDEDKDPRNILHSNLLKKYTENGYNNTTVETDNIIAGTDASQPKATENSISSYNKTNLKQEGNENSNNDTVLQKVEIYYDSNVRNVDPVATASNETPPAASLEPVIDSISKSVHQRLQSPKRPLSEDRDSAFWDDQDPDASSLESDISSKNETTETLTVGIDGSINDVQPKSPTLQENGNTRSNEVNNIVNCDSLSGTSQQNAHGDCIVDKRNQNELRISKSRNNLASAKTVNQTNIAVTNGDIHSNTELCESTLASDDQPPTVSNAKINSSLQSGKLSNNKYPIQAKEKSHITTDKSGHFKVPFKQNPKTDNCELLFGQHSFIFDTHRNYRDRFDDVYVYKLIDDWSRETSIDVTDWISKGDEKTKQADEQSLSQAASELSGNDSPNKMPVKIEKEAEVRDKWGTLSKLQKLMIIFKKELDEENAHSEDFLTSVDLWKKSEVQRLFRIPATERGICLSETCMNAQTAVSSIEPEDEREHTKSNSERRNKDTAEDTELIGLSQRNQSSKSNDLETYVDQYSRLETESAEGVQKQKSNNTDIVVINDKDNAQKQKDISADTQQYHRLSVETLRARDNANRQGDRTSTPKSSTSGYHSISDAKSFRSLSESHQKHNIEKEDYRLVQSSITHSLPVKSSIAHSEPVVSSTANGVVKQDDSSSIRIQENKTNQTAAIDKQETIQLEKASDSIIIKDKISLKEHEYDQNCTGTYITLDKTIDDSNVRNVLQHNHIADETSHVDSYRSIPNLNSTETIIENGNASFQPLVVNDSPQELQRKEVVTIDGEKYTINENIDLSVEKSEESILPYKSENVLKPGELRSDQLEPFQFSVVPCNTPENMNFVSKSEFLQEPGCVHEPTKKALTHAKRQTTAKNRLRKITATVQNLKRSQKKTKQTIKSCSPVKGGDTNGPLRFNGRLKTKSNVGDVNHDDEFKLPRIDEGLTTHRQRSFVRLMHTPLSRDHSKLSQDSRPDSVPVTEICGILCTEIGIFVGRDGQMYNSYNEAAQSTRTDYILRDLTRLRTSITDIESKSRPSEKRSKTTLTKGGIQLENHNLDGRTILKKSLSEEKGNIEPNKQLPITKLTNGESTMKNKHFVKSTDGIFIYKPREFLYRKHISSDVFRSCFNAIGARSSLYQTSLEYDGFHRLSKKERALNSLRKKLVFV